MKNSLNQSECPATMIVLSFRLAAHAAKSSIRCSPRKPRPFRVRLKVRVRIRVRIRVRVRVGVRAN